MSRSRVWDGKQKNSAAGAGDVFERGIEAAAGGRRRATAFYIETLVLAAVFTAVILVLVRVFALSEQTSIQARVLTNAVRLAENAAEAVAASESVQELADLLDQGGNVILEDGALRAGYDLDMEPGREGDFCLEAEWNPQESGAGNLVRCRISVRWKDEEEPVYVLETAVYLERQAMQN